MRVFVTGATGVLGHRLVERLTDRGHDVVGLVRDDHGAELVADRGGRPHRGDVLEPETLERAADADAIVHAATAIPTEPNPSADDWERNDRVRLQGARNLLAVAGDDVESFYFPSVVWVARQPDGSAFDEESTRHPDRTTRSAVAVEDLLEETSRSHDFDATVLRCGYLYAPDGANARRLGRTLLSGELRIVGGGVLGRRDAELSVLHAADAARAFVAAIEAGVNGTYHVVDEERVTFASFVAAFADLLEVPMPGRVPAWLARFAVGEDFVRLVTNPMPTSAERFRRDAGWEPSYPTYREGIRDVVATWQETDAVRVTGDGYEWAGSTVGRRRSRVDGSA
ncbi:NAD-dependent epimerase/dehydratase family protein [Natronobacterium texcoconense]|uniref:Nucleoside-diphosphate-sugar epimerase n=1 Tax=Natronobacterium texcoconense TaxID=1095778 RepID=A0A1H1IS07_NATTX|nr:NAD(P)-dependent oxidoreductase [Natronobacterium texcoconense]SDR40511.1 Nucleoside-diphosphate-sugar epimerase [Natronobacterium texcoconense]